MKINSLRFITLILCIISFPFGFQIAPAIRLLDIFIILFVLLSYYEIKAYGVYFYSLIILLFVFLISSTLGFIDQKDFKPEGVIFYYKYFIPFIFFSSISKFSISDEKLKRLVNFSFGIFSFLILWVFAYYAFKFSGAIVGHTRVSFPFSDYESSDAHLYSVYIGLSIVFFTFFHYQVKRNLISKLIYVLAIPALLATGSRSGLLLIIIFSSLYILLTYPYLFILLGVISISIFSIFLSIFDKDMSKTDPDSFLDLIYPLIQRAINFDLSDDDSASTRVESLRISVDETMDTFHVFGNGFFYSKLGWYDGTFSNLLANGGILSLLVLFIILSIFTLEMYKRSRICKHYLLVCFTTAFFLVNSITEYFLVTRGFFYFIIYYFLIINSKAYKI